MKHKCHNVTTRLTIWVSCHGETTRVALQPWMQLLLLPFKGTALPWQRLSHDGWTIRGLYPPVYWCTFRTNRDICLARGRTHFNGVSVFWASSRSAEEVQKQLDHRIHLILDGGISPCGLPSTVVDCMESEIRILRPGPLALSQLEAALE